MIGFEIKDGFIDFSNPVFNCPYCDKEHIDNNDKYMNRCNKNKSGVTKVNCNCGKFFSITYDYMGDAVSFL